VEAVALATLWLTGSPEAAILVVAVVGHHRRRSPPRLANGVAPLVRPERPTSRWDGRCGSTRTTLTIKAPRTGPINLVATSSRRLVSGRSDRPKQCGAGQSSNLARKNVENFFGASPSNWAQRDHFDGLRRLLSDGCRRHQLGQGARHPRRTRPQLGCRLDCRVREASDSAMR
jgi:hypothetical protein